MKLYFLTFGIGMVGGLLALAYDQAGWTGDDSRSMTEIAASQAVAQNPVRAPSSLAPHARGRNGHGNPVTVDTAAFETVVVDSSMPIRIEHALDRRPVPPARSHQPAR